MNVTRAFMADFIYLTDRYGWNADDIEEVKAHMREHFEPMRRYWSTLAAAHRAGYEQTRENGYMRLHIWCEQHEPSANFQTPQVSQSDAGDQP